MKIISTKLMARFPTTYVAYTVSEKSISNDKMLVTLFGFDKIC